MREKSLNKILRYAAIVIVLGGATVVLLPHNRSKAPANSLPPDFLSVTTPTPYSLPTTAYDLSPAAIITPGTPAEESGPPIDPDRIETEGQLQAKGEHLDLYSIDGYLPVEIPWWQEQSKPVYEYVSKRLDVTMSSRISITFLRPQSTNCPARGLTFTDRPLIAIFADENTSQEQILGVLAHELGHVLAYQKYQNLRDLALSEGIATWAAGEYWKKWKGFDFNSGVKMFIHNGSYLPLFENYDLKKAYDNTTPECLAQRDILYTEMASFLDYLLQRYGPEKLAALLNVPPSKTIDDKRVVYPPRYKDIYGLEFNQLEYEWLKTLVQASPGG